MDPTLFDVGERDLFRCSGGMNGFFGVDFEACGLG